MAADVIKALECKELKINCDGSQIAFDCRTEASSGRAAFFYSNVSEASAQVVSIHQDHVTAAIPVLQLRQDDESEGFIAFSGSDRGVIAAATASSKSVRVELDGVIYRLALYVDA